MTKRQKSLVSSFFQFYDETTKKSVVSSFFQFYDETTKTSVVSSLFSILWRNYKKILFLSYFSKEETTKKKTIIVTSLFTGYIIRSLDAISFHWMQEAVSSLSLDMVILFTRFLQKWKWKKYLFEYRFQLAFFSTIAMRYWEGLHQLYNI